MIFLRKLLLLGIAITAIVLAVLIYGRLSGSKDPSDSTVAPPLPSTPTDLTDIKRIAPRRARLDSGEKLAYERRGPGGIMRSAYYAEQLSLKSEDQALLEDVRLIWYLSDGQTLSLTSRKGQVEIERGPLGRLQPVGGRLWSNVRIVLAPRPRKTEPRPLLANSQPQEMIITTEQLEFDTTSSRLWTDGPVQLTGPNLQADGTGLLLRWREISQQIDTLIIQQGGQLTYRLTQRPAKTKMPPPEQPQSPAHGPQAPKLHSYLASFQQNVRVIYKDQDKDQILENVDRLNLIFDMTARRRADKPSESPRATTAARDQQPSIAPPVPVLQLTWDGKLTVVPTQQAPDPADTQRRFQIQATGQPVRFASQQISGSCAKLQAKKQTGIITLLSSPEFKVDVQLANHTTVLTQQADIDTTAATAKLLGKGSIKTSRPDDQPASKTTQPLLLTWLGRADLKFGKDPAPQASNLSPRDLLASGADLYYLSQARAEQQVALTSEQLNAKAGWMEIKLAPPGSDGTERGQTVNLLRAGNTFSAELPSDHLSVSAKSMQAQFSPRDSRPGQFLSAIDLSDNVLLTRRDPDQPDQDQLHCQKLRVDLKEDKIATPDKQSRYGNTRVVHLLAQENVIGRNILHGQVRSSFTAEKLDSDPENQITVLYGKAGKPAKLEKGNDYIESAIIRIRQIEDDQNNYVLSTPGPGQMEAAFAPDKPGQPVPILGLNWPGTMKFDSQANTANFDGLKNARVTGAIVHSPTRWSKLEANSLQLYLKDKEKDKKVDKGAVKANSDAVPDQAPAAEPFLKPIAAKDLEKMILKGAAQVRSVEHVAGQEERLRAVLLESDTLTYNVATEQFDGQGPGLLLLEDYRPTDQQVAGDRTTSVPGATAPKTTSSLKLRRVDQGQTAFWWQDSARYRQTDQIATLRGNVHMVSRGYALSLPSRSPPDAEYGKKRRQRTELWCQNFSVTFAQPPAGQASKTNTFADLSQMDELRIASIQAHGSATLLSSDVSIEGQTISYDTKTHLIQINGSRHQKASLTYLEADKAQWMHWTGRKVQYDTLKRQGSAESGKLEVLR